MFMFFCIFFISTILLKLEDKIFLLQVWGSKLNFLETLHCVIVISLPQFSKGFTIILVTSKKQNKKLWLMLTYTYYFSFYFRISVILSFYSLSQSKSAGSCLYEGSFWHEAGVSIWLNYFITSRWNLARSVDYSDILFHLHTKRLQVS